jgi:TatD DNase family protein
MEFIDTHCHIHFDDYPLDSEEALVRAHLDGVNTCIVVGCTIEDSRQGIVFATNRKGVWASVGVHPHEAKHHSKDLDALSQSLENMILSSSDVVAVGEIGLDYFYNNSDKQSQIAVLHTQLAVAHKHGKPVILHVRQAFDDFWPIFDMYPGLNGVVHSFSAVRKDVDDIINRGLYVGLNGIMTFTKDDLQLEAAKSVPLENLLLETDAPHLTPVPFRGTMGEPKYVRVTAEFLARLRGESLEKLAKSTTANARKLFSI